MSEIHFEQIPLKVVKEGQKCGRIGRTLVLHDRTRPIPPWSRPANRPPAIAKIPT
jgi:hypothetical protein